MSQQKEQWHLSKSVPVTLILAILIQTGGGIWWASSMNAQVENMSKSLSEYIEENDAENLRQWSRINANENLVSQASNEAAITRAILERVEDDIREVKELIKTLDKRGAERN